MFDIQSYLHTNARINDRMESKTMRSEQRHDELLRAAEVAARLKISKSQAYALMQKNELPVVRLGRCVRVSAKALDRWIEAQLQQS
jgi:excisionase family DNA binding protein